MKRILLVVFAVILVLSSVMSVGAKTVLGKKETENYIEKISEYITSNNKNPGFGSSGGEWAITALARSGQLSEDYKSKYLENLAQKLKECDGILHQRKYTEYSRVVIALTSLGIDATNFYGYNLVSPLAEMDSVTKQGVNGAAYALIALDCGNYDIPSPKSDYHGNVTTRKALLEEILTGQTGDGGWNTVGTKADTDVTAMVIQALAPYYQKEADVKKAVDVGLECLSNLQLADGSYGRGESKNCESTAQVLTALSGMNINIEDSRFVKNQKTVLDGLFQYYKNGGFCHLPAGNVNEMATEQALYALVAYHRSISGEEGLYEISKDTKMETKKSEEETTQKKKIKMKEKTSEEKNSKDKASKDKTAKEKAKKNSTQEKETNLLNQSMDASESTKESAIESTTESVTESASKKSKNQKKSKKETTDAEIETVIMTQENGETEVIAAPDTQQETDLEGINKEILGKSFYKKNIGKYIIGGLLFIGICFVAGYFAYKRFG